MIFLYQKILKKLFPFGSLTQYTQTENSDLEITIIMKSYESYNENLSESFLEKKKKLEENYINEFTNITMYFFSSISSKMLFISYLFLFLNSSSPISSFIIFKIFSFISLDE